MQNSITFINNLSWLAVLLFIMCLIGLAVFLIYLIIRRYKKELEIATGQDWFHKMCEDAYLNQQKSVKKIKRDLNIH